jgi:hypothetical protein
MNIASTYKTPFALAKQVQIEKFSEPVWWAMYQHTDFLARSVGRDLKLPNFTDPEAMHQLCTDVTDSTKEHYYRSSSENSVSEIQTYISSKIVTSLAEKFGHYSRVIDWSSRFPDGHEMHREIMKAAMLNFLGAMEAKNQLEVAIFLIKKREAPNGVEELAGFWDPGGDPVLGTQKSVLLKIWQNRSLDAAQRQANRYEDDLQMEIFLSMIAPQNGIPIRTAISVLAYRHDLTTNMARKLVGRGAIDRADEAYAMAIIDHEVIQQSARNARSLSHFGARISLGEAK